jgi:hypothetical protein
LEGAFVLIKLKFWQKKPGRIEKLYERQLSLTIRQANYAKEFNDVAWNLEKKRNPGEYIR